MRRRPPPSQFPWGTVIFVLIHVAALFLLWAYQDEVAKFVDGLRKEIHGRPPAKVSKGR